MNLCFVPVYEMQPLDAATRQATACWMPRSAPPASRTVVTPVASVVSRLRGPLDGRGDVGGGQLVFTHLTDPRTVAKPPDSTQEELVHLFR
jgi:hypothetical protein